MTLFRLALRSHRTGLVVLSVLGAVTGALNAGAFAQLAGTTPAERAAFGQQMAVVGRQLSFLLPDPVRLDTLGGYLTWRAFGFLGLIFSIWAILASTGMGRGEEEKGLTEHWLATGIGRVRWLVTRTAGFAAAATLATAVTLGVTALPVAASADALPVVPLAETGLVLLGVTLTAFGIGLVLSQLVVTRRAAGSIGSVVIIALYELNAAGSSGMTLGPLAGLSPFALSARSHPLVVGGTLDVAATAALYAAAAVLVAVAALAFLRRDVAGPLLRFGTPSAARAVTRPSADPLLRVAVLSLVDQQRWWLAGWTVALAALAWFLASLARTMVDSMLAIPSLRVYFDRLGVSAYADFVGVLWFGTALFVLSALAIAQVNGWAADDAEGRLEATLAAGASRERVVLERIAALLVIAAVASAASSAVVFAVTRTVGIPLPGDRFVLATLLVLPVVFALAGIGAGLAGWRPRVAVPLLGTVAVVSYFIQQFAAVFDWPKWIGRLSIFQLYGQPLSKDDWTGWLTLVAIGIAGTAIALVTIRRRDVGV